MLFRSLLWHALGAKTIDLIHQHVTVRSVRDDLETLVMDAELMNELLKDPDKKIVEVEIKITGRLRRGKGPKFIELSQRLEALRLKAVEVLPYDTCAAPERFFSYRRATKQGEPVYGREISAIGIGG